jgi:hypothetical protein
MVLPQGTLITEYYESACCVCVTRAVKIVCVDLKSVDKGISVVLTVYRIEQFYYLFISLFIYGLIDDIFIAPIA